MGRTDEKYLRFLKERYRRAIKEERTAILGEFVKTTGYHRRYATALLNVRQRRSQGRIKRPCRGPKNGPEAARALLALSPLSGHIDSGRRRMALTAVREKLFKTLGQPETGDLAPAPGAYLGKIHSRGNTQCKLDPWCSLR